MNSYDANALWRRNFLLRLWHAASLGFLRPAFGQPSADKPIGGVFHPHYRSAAALDAVVSSIAPGLDGFVIEKDHDRIAEILARWSEDLLKSPSELNSVLAACGDRFAGVSLRPSSARTVRSDPNLEVHAVSFSGEAALQAEAFAKELRNSLAQFSKVTGAEFQVTRIVRGGSGEIDTRVRYQIVGTGHRFHYEQRIGAWNLLWEPIAEGDYRIKRWHAEGETRSRSLRPWYVDIAPHAFEHCPAHRQQFDPGIDHWRTVLDAASGIDIYGHNGVAVGDIDNDGFDDLYICQPGGLPNRLYRNRGDGTFEDVTEASGVGLLDNTACALFVDIDNDGREDLVVVRTSGPLLFLNQGGGKFKLKPDAFQFAHPPAGTFTGAAAADYDRDGWLDIYFCVYAYYQGAGQYNYPTPYFAAENGPPNFLMRNNRDGSFSDVTARTGLDKNNTRFSFCCGWNDFNRDGWPDLYVVNDFGHKNLYRNNGDGTFTDVASAAGVEDIGAGMGVAWQDFNNDGIEDLYVANMWTAAGERISNQTNFKKDSSDHVRALYQKHAMGNSLLRNRGDGTFEDATAASGAGNGGWSWSSDAFDFDHDGFADLYIANGMVSGPERQDLNSFFWRQVVANSPDAEIPSPDYEQAWNGINELIRSDYTWSGYERNVSYANNRDGTFSDVSAAIGLDFVEDSRAFALADFDHDGRQEILLKNRSGPQVRLLKNVVDKIPPSIAFRLRGVKSNRDAIGAVVTLVTDAGRQTRSVQAGSGFLSQHSKEVFFGLGSSSGPISVTIRWPSGLVQEVKNLAANHRIFVEEGQEPSRSEPYQPRTAVSASDAHAGEQRSDLHQTWLLAPVPAPDFQLPGSSARLSSLRGSPVLLSLTRAEERFVRAPIEAVTLRAGGSGDTGAIYNILYRSLFDRHRDLALPTSFLIDESGQIVKVYRGPVEIAVVVADSRQISRNANERLARALPFAGNAATYEYGRNHLSLPGAFYQRGYYEQAEEIFRVALHDDPSSAEAQYGLGSVYLKQEKIAEARGCFEQAVKLSAEYRDTLPNAWNNLGLLATREGRIDTAAGYFKQALRLNPNHWVSLENLGNAYRQQKRWSEARQALERALQLRPQDPEASYSLAMVFAQTDDPQRAYELLRRAIELRPAYPEALNNLAILYLRTNRRDEAVRTFEECMRVAPGFDQSYLNLARVYAAEGDREKARAVLRELLQQHPGHKPAQQALEQLQ